MQNKSRCEIMLKVHLFKLEEEKHLLWGMKYKKVKHIKKYIYKQSQGY